MIAQGLQIAMFSVCGLLQLVGSAQEGDALCPTLYQTLGGIAGRSHIVDHHG